MASNEDKGSDVEQNGPSGNRQKLQERAFPKSGRSAEVERTGTKNADNFPDRGQRPGGNAAT